MTSSNPTHLATDARIVIVDDHEANVALLQQVLQGAGYSEVIASTDSSEAVPLCTEEPADLLLLDLHMPPPDGVEVISELNRRELRFPIIVLTADDTPQAKLRALGAGARDFLSKPFDLAEVLLRIENHLKIQLLQRQLRSQNEHLEERSGTARESSRTPSLKPSSASPSSPSIATTTPASTCGASAAPPPCSPGRCSSQSTRST